MVVLDTQEKRCPCFHGELSTLEYVLNAFGGRVLTDVPYCPLLCDIFFDSEDGIWRDHDTWEPWNGVELEGAS